MTATEDLNAGMAAAGFSTSSSASAIARAARGLFDHLPFQDVNIAAVAQAAGVNEVTVYRIFGSKDGLAAACWIGNMEKVRRGLQRDRQATKDPLDRVKRHLRRLADVSIKDRAITLAMIQAVEAQTIERGREIGALDPRKIIPIPSLLDPLVAEAQEAGQIAVAYTSFELAAFLTNSVFIRLMTRPDATANEVAAFVSDVVLDGITTGTSS